MASGTVVALTTGCGDSGPEVVAAPSSHAVLAEWRGAFEIATDPRRWPDGTYSLPEIMQGGAGLLDFDGDGDLDVLHVVVPPPGAPSDPAPNRLYRQEADGRFTEVGARAGLADPGFGQGLAVGDVDNDGDVDVYVTNYGADRFYLNSGDGTFLDRTGAAGFSGERWSVSATFCDYDGDADLDLYVTHYLKFDPDHVCLDAADRQEYCGPQTFPGEPDVLFRNDGSGRFMDVSAEAGIVLPDGGESARGMGVVCADLSGDGLPDFYVANDGESNQLWINRGDGTFVDEAILRGVAVNRQGKTEAGMGVVAGDVNGDGWLDLFVTHLVLENNTLYLGSEGRLFEDGTQQAGMAPVDQPFTGFGCAMLDLDHDGDLDIAVVNGGVRRGPGWPGQRVGRFWAPYAEPNLLFANDGQGRFDHVSQSAGPFGAAVEVSRGLATGDLDGDGDLDLVVTNADNRLRVYRNEAPPAGHHWLIVRVLEHGRDASGVDVTLHAGDRRWRRVAGPGFSYASASDPRVHFGLGPIDRADRLQVRWSDGTDEVFEIGGVDRIVTVARGSGEAP